MTPLPQPMTSRERLLATLRGQEPDRVPVVPDVSNMMPCRYTGKPYWEVYVNNNPPMWRAHIALQQRFGYDMILSGDLGASPDDPPAESRIISTDEEQWVVEKTIHTAQGNLSTITAYPRARSPWNIKPLITDPEAEIPALLATLTDPWRKSTSHATEVRQAVGDKGIIRVTVSVPLAWWLYARLHMD
ncbi:MAG: hypothetical protein FJ280_26085, partial [Planctomycetes bacterium]|nr:hypothetical protein [Planctomycetota bacterium]